MEPSRRRRRRRSVSSVGSPAICVSAPQYVAEDLLRAEGFTDRAATSRRRPAARSSSVRSRPARSTSACTSSPSMIVEPRRRRSDRVPRRGPRRLLRAVRHRARPHDPRPEGKDRRPCRARRPRHARLPRRACLAHVGLDPAQGHRLGHPSRGRVGAAPRRGQDRRVPGVPARAPGAAREEDRSRRASTARVDRPWSQYFCCMVAANRDFVREASGRHQARRCARS